MKQPDGGARGPTNAPAGVLRGGVKRRVQAGTHRAPVEEHRPAGARRARDGLGDSREMAHRVVSAACITFILLFPCLRGGTSGNGGAGSPRGG